jgi:hypothetical protein
VCVLPHSFAHAAIGRIGRPAFPAPLIGEGGTSPAKLARNARRDREAVSRYARCLKFESQLSSPGSSPLRDLTCLSRSVPPSRGLRTAFMPGRNYRVSERFVRVQPNRDEAVAIRALSVYAFASLRLRRTLLRPYGLRLAAPRVAREGEAWWGKKDSNLRSHKTADLQSAPFATRDTPPLNSIATHPPKWRRSRPWMTLKPRDPSKVRGRAVYGGRPMAKSTNAGRYYLGLGAQIAIIRNP